MAIATFDTLKFANTLKAAGVPDKQAEAEATVLAEALAVNFKDLVTKDDLKQALVETEQRLNARIDLIRADFNAKIDLVRADFNAKIDLIRPDFNTKIDLVRADLTARSDRLEAKFDGQLTLLKWMFGVMVSMGAAFLIRSFFVRSF